MTLVNRVRAGLATTATGNKYHAQLDMMERVCKSMIRQINT